jgi:outer membrane receptor protein involved in Fe transport
MPSFNELYYQLVGNARLLPENANQLNLGVLANLSFYNKSHIRLTADVFKNRISNKIIAVPTQNLFVWSMQNIGKVSTTGAEILIEGLFKAGEKTNISASLGYTWQEALDVSDKTSETYEHQIPYVPYETFSGRIQLGYQNLSLDYNILFNGFRYSAATNIHQNLLPSWWISDAGLSWNLPAKRFSYKLKAEITNLLDKEYVVIRSFPMPGRSFGFSAALNF